MSLDKIIVTVLLLACFVAMLWAYWRYRRAVALAPCRGCGRISGHEPGCPAV